jgi:hypothetical protein
MERERIVKNTGPDVDRIPRTQRTLGPRHRHLILGYPPFLKHLIDLTDASGFDIVGLGEHVDGTRLSLPFVWVYDGRDYTVNVTGANIYPKILSRRQQTLNIPDRELE